MTGGVHDFERCCGHSRRVHRIRGDEGAFAALELVIIVPFVVVMLLIVVAFGRVSRGRQLVDQAAQAASRAASLSESPTLATKAAKDAAVQTLSGGGLSCAIMSLELDTSQFHAGGKVIARVTCRADLSGLAMAGVPGAVTLTSSSTSPLETYREFTGSTP